MTNFFRKHSREKLYKQWVEKEGLSPDDLPADLKKEVKDSPETEEATADVVPTRGELRQKMSQPVDNILSSISVRFILGMALVIVILLVALSVVSTVLIMRGC